MHPKRKCAGRIHFVFLPPIPKPSTCCFASLPYIHPQEHNSASRHSHIQQATAHVLSAPGQEDHDRLQGVEHLGNTEKHIGIDSPGASELRKMKTR